MRVRTTSDMAPPSFRMARSILSRIATVWHRAHDPPTIGKMDSSPRGGSAVVPDTRIISPTRNGRSEALIPISSSVEQDNATRILPTAIASQGPSA